MRDVLKSLTGPGVNPGLALDRFVPWPKDDKKRPPFFQGVATAKHDPAYAAAFGRWKALVTERKALVCTATLGGPLAVGLGNESPSEVGLTLHRIYGMPLIPGSAVKGTCLRALAGQEIVARDTLFGSVNNAGYATFHDAWYVPGSAGDAPLQVDTVTVHHPLYYQNDGKKGFPTDFDDPTPVPFISVKPGAQFLFAIEVPTGWEEFAEKMLHHALTQIGLGGKTNAGYGWFDPNSLVWERPPVVLSPEQEVAAIRKQVDGLLARVAQLDASRLGQDTIPILESAAHLGASQEVARALRDRADRIGRWKKTEDKAWHKAIAEVLQ